MDTASELVDDLLHWVHDLDPLHRMFCLWAFCLGGILIACQASQLGEEARAEWTKLTPGRAPFWYTLYNTVILALLTGSFGVFKAKMENYFIWFGQEEKILNGLWISLVGLEVVMVIVATFMTFTRQIKSAPKQKTQ